MSEEVKVNGQTVNPASTVDLDQQHPIMGLVMFLNEKWKEGDPPADQFLRVALPPGASAPSFEPTPQGYKLYFDQREVRDIDGVVVSQEERTSHHELFFTPERIHVASRVWFTEWSPIKADRRRIISLGHSLLTSKRPKPS
jgi:hypothetical protein